MYTYMHASTDMHTQAPAATVMICAIAYITGNYHIYALTIPPRRQIYTKPHQKTWFKLGLQGPLGSVAHQQDPNNSKSCFPLLSFFLARGPYACIFIIKNDDNNY